MNYRKETQPHGDELFPLSIHVFETDLQSTVRVYCHWHEEEELFYAVKGEAVFHMDTETFLLREGETAFVNANRLHEVEGIDGQEFTFLAVVFQPRFLSGTSLDRIQQQYIEPVLSSEIRFPSKTERGTRLAEKTAQAMQEIRNLQERKEPGWELLLKAELLKIWQGYYSAAEKNGGKTDASTNYRVSRMKEILTYMNAHFCEDLEIAELASQFHMSESAFCRFFKSITCGLPRAAGCCFPPRRRSAGLRATADSEISAILTASSRNACTRRRGSSAVYPQKTVLRYKIRNLCRLLRSECTPQEEKSGHISQCPADRNSDPDSGNAKRRGGEKVCQRHTHAKRNDGQNNRHLGAFDSAVIPVQQKQPSDAEIERAFQPQVLYADRDDLHF